MENKGSCGGAEKSAGNCSTETTGSCGSGGEKKCCPGTIIKGALAGGIVMFVYFWASWSLLPWHKGTLPDGFTMTTDMNGAMIKQFLFCLLGAALLTKVLKKRKEGCCPVAGSMLVGLLVAVFANLPGMIWFSFPGGYTLTGMADDFLAITLAGLAISCAVFKSSMGACCCPVCKCMSKCCNKGSCGDKAAGSCGDKPTGSCGDKDKTGSCH